MDQKLNKEEIIKIISLYRSHDVLWNMGSKSYRRNDLKVKAYEDIASEMGMSSDVVKKKIRSLRATYTGEKSKMYKKSGSSTDEIYQSSLFWFDEMRFLDSSIAVRNSCDNSEKTNNVNSQQLNESTQEYIQSDSFTNKKTNKRPREDEDSKFDEALQKLIDASDKENEFTSFGTSIAYQLQKLPEEDAYELMGEMQLLLTKKKLKIARDRRFRPITENESSWCSENSLDGINTSTPIAKCFKERPISTSTSTSTSRDILSCAILNAEIVLE